jgi:hypothetical protein
VSAILTVPTISHRRVPTAWFSPCLGESSGGSTRRLRHFKRRSPSSYGTWPTPRHYGGASPSRRTTLFRCSSTVERPAVNWEDEGASPSAGAILVETWVRIPPRASKARVVQRTGRHPSLPVRITRSSPLSESGWCKCEPCPGSQFTRVWCQIGGDSARNGDYAGASPVTLTISLRCRLTSRTAGFEPVHGGANPPAAANLGIGAAERGHLTRNEDIRRMRLPRSPPIYGGNS